MRAIAVLMVLAVHASPSALPNGFVGVDVFFVISGYLITSILCQELAQDRFSVRDFYVRRINRIFPALLLVLGTCLAIAPWLLYPSERGMLSKSAFFSTVFAANVHFYLESGYWDVASKLKPLLHLWSLGVEEHSTWSGLCSCGAPAVPASRCGRSARAFWCCRSSPIWS